MSTATESRLAELDSVLDGVGTSPALSGQLFGVVDALDASPALRRALSDPAADGSAKQALASTLFGPRVDESTLAVVKAAAAARWASPKRLADAVERQGVRAALAEAGSRGVLDLVVDELFRFGQIVACDHALREALADGRTPLQAREQLVRQLLEGRAESVTVALATRAVKARQRTFALTLDGYATAAAQLRDRRVAKVTVAQEMDASQVERLKLALTRMSGHQVDVQVTVDPEVLGGVRVQLGDEVIEGTVSHRLEDARRQIA